MKSINMDELIGQKAKLYACNNLNQFQLGTVIFEVMEDESDGYRSHLKSVDVIKQDADLRLFLDDVTIEKNPDDNYEIHSIEKDHVWVEFGTDYSDSYYPCFFFRFHPLPSITEILNRINL